MISEPRPLLRADARYRKRRIECKFGLALSPTIPCWSLCLHFSGCDSMHMCLALFSTSFVGLLSTDSTFVQCHSLPGLHGNLGSFNSFSHHCDKTHWQKQHRNLFWFIIYRGQSIVPGESWWMEAIEPVVVGGWGCWFLSHWPSANRVGCEAGLPIKPQVPPPQFLQRDFASRF